MSQDKMQDVFPIEFDFVSGEQPDAVKFTSWRKQTDTAFDRIVAAIGDPWEYNTHSAGGSNYYLSPSRLAQPSLARMIGPSDYVSPKGASFNEGITSDVRVTLEQNRSSWRLGFPLKKKIGADMGPNSSFGYAGSLSDISFGSDITLVSSPSGQFLIANLKTYLTDVTASGDWHIDYNKGVITSYDTMSSASVFNISNINMFGPGTPWGTANVIPSWEQTSGLCVVAGGPTTWTISLPIVNTGPRSSGLTYTEDVYWNTSVPGESAKHRLPYALTSALGVGDSIPSGFVQLWEESTNRVMPLVSFFYRDEYSLTVTTPENLLTVGEHYRIIVTGSSLAENVSWLMSVVRDTAHDGLTDCQDGKTIAYTVPVSHDNLTDLYNGELLSTIIEVEKYKYTKSNYPTNPHPQYLHRAGYMENDVDGNSANAMRGDLVFSSVDTYAVDNDTDTYGITWGSGTSVYSHLLAFEGGASSSNPMPFGIDGIGIRKDSSSDKYGAVTFRSADNLPLYFRSSYGTTGYDSGPTLAFDWDRNREMNYLKLLNPVSTIAEGVPHLPINSATMISWSTVLDITPSLSNRLGYQGFREFRFRSVSNYDSATNDGLTSGGDFDKFFTNPGIVGADFLNVYSNAIFFSDQGDGITSSLQEHRDWFVDDSADAPVGLYYEPLVTGALYRFVTSDLSAGTDTVAYFGYDSFLINPPNSAASIIGGSDFVSMLLTSGSKIELVRTASTDEIDIFSTNTTTIRATEQMTMSSDASMSLNSIRNIGLNVTATDNINYGISFSAVSGVADTAYNDRYSDGAICPDYILLTHHIETGAQRYLKLWEDEITLYASSGDIVLDTNVSGDVNVTPAGNIYLEPASDIYLRANDIYLGTGSTTNLTSITPFNVRYLPGAPDDGGVIEFSDAEIGIKHGKTIRIVADSDDAGTSGNIVLEANSVNSAFVVVTGLPTSDPGGTGRLWNNSGVINIT